MEEQLYELNPFLSSRNYKARLADGRVVGAGDTVSVSDIDLTESALAYGRRSPLWTPYTAPEPEVSTADYLDGLTKPELKTVAASRDLPTGGTKTELIAMILEDEQSPSAD